MDKAEDEADAKNMPGIILEDSEFESCDQAAFKEGEPDAKRGKGLWGRLRAVRTRKVHKKTCLLLSDFIF